MNQRADANGYAKAVVRIALITGAALLVPLITMQFTDAVDWSMTDFIVAGCLLLGAGVVYEFAIRKVHSPKSRVFVTIAIGLLLLLVWAELAVGVFGTPFSGS